MNTFKMARFVNDRDTALLSMDENTIRAFMNKYGIPASNNDKVFWIAVHKARTGIKTFDPIEKAKSIQWLTERGYTHYAEEVN